MPNLLCIAACRSLLRLALIAGLGALPIGCSHAKLDDSFGLRNREVFRVQTAQRNPRDIVNSGQAAEGAVAKLYQKLAPSENGGGAAAPSASASPLKIPALSR